MKNKCLIRRRLFIAALILWLCVIFAFSAQNGEQSSKLSDPAANYISDTVSVSENTAITAVRKGAHAAEYAILGFLLCGVLCSVEKMPERFALCMLFVLLLAAADEIHQYFVPGRHGCFSDVLIDLCGAFLGAAVYFALKALKAKKVKAGK